MSKVAIIRCETYDTHQVQAALQRGLDLLGGIGKFVKPTDKVLLKPNLLSGKPPEKAVTTHPAVLEGMINILQEKNYQFKYGDSPGFGRPEAVASKAGLSEVAEKYSVSLADFTQGEVVSFPAGRQCKHFEIANAAQEANAIISLCKMKSHGLTRITGAVKNQLGCVYGINKGAFHVKFPDSDSFSKMLVDLNLLLRPRLFIMDGIMAMEGNGPNSGDPTPMNVLIISADPVAVDATFCRMIDLDPELIPTITYGEEYGLGRYRLEDIEYVGDPLDSFANPDFDIPRSPVRSEGLKAAPFFRRHMLRRPFIREEKCIKCGICVQSCPVEGKALSFTDEQKNKPPHYDYDKCIRCYCCQEMCPEHAIDIRTPLLGRLLLYR